MIYDDIYSFKVGRVSESREKGKGGEERRERERGAYVERGAKSRTLERSRIRAIPRGSWCTDRAKVIPAWFARCTAGTALHGKWSRQFIRTGRVLRILTWSLVILPFAVIKTSQTS